MCYIGAQLWHRGEGLVSRVTGRRQSKGCVWHMLLLKPMEGAQQGHFRMPAESGGCPLPALPTSHTSGPDRQTPHVHPLVSSSNLAGTHLCTITLGLGYLYLL